MRKKYRNRIWERKRIWVRIGGILTGAALLGGIAGCGIFDTGNRETGKNSGKSEGISLDVWVFFDENTPGTYYVDLWKELAEEKGYDIDLKTYSTENIKYKFKISLTFK